MACGGPRRWRHRHTSYLKVYPPPHPWRAPQRARRPLFRTLELKELRLAHNEIMTIPSEFGHLVKLQNLDMGNNLITNGSNLKVLSSLVNLRNLNLQGNPIAEKEKLLKKVKRLLPNLHIFNSRRIVEIAAKELHEKADDFSTEADNKLTLRSETKIDDPMRKKNSSKARSIGGSMDYADAGDLGSRNKRKELQGEKGVDSSENADVSENKRKKKLKLQKNEPNITDDVAALDVNSEEGKKSKHKKQKNHQLARPDVKSDTVGKGKDPDEKSRKSVKGDKGNIIDSAERPFMDLFTSGVPEVLLETADSKLDHRTDQAIDAMSGLATLPTKKKNRNRAVDPAALGLSQVDEIGLGGSSAWDV